jgi:hypothetical protein
MQFCSIFQPNPIFTAVTTTTLTVSGLTPAGFVKTATGAGGLLSTEAFGANTYIPYSSGSGFTYSANLTFTDPNLACAGGITSLSQTLKSNTVLYTNYNMLGAYLLKGNQAATSYFVLPNQIGTGGDTGTAENTSFKVIGKINNMLSPISTGNPTQWEYVDLWYYVGGSTYMLRSSCSGPGGSYAIRPLTLAVGAHLTQFVLNTDGTCSFDDIVKINHITEYTAYHGTIFDASVATSTTLTTKARYLKVSVSTSAYTVDSGATLDDVVVCNSTTAFAVSIPSSYGAGRILTITNVNTGNITVTAYGASTIAGEATITLVQYESIQIVDYAIGKWCVI